MLSGTEIVELVAMADVFEDKLELSLRRLRDLIELQEVAIVPLTESSFKTQTI